MTAARILAMPVASMNSGSLKGGFSTPRLPIKKWRFWHQCFGTGTTLRYDLSSTSSRGSAAVTSHCSTTSGLCTSCLSSATESRFCSFFFFFDTTSASGCSGSSASAAAAADDDAPASAPASAMGLSRLSAL